MDTGAVHTVVVGRLSEIHTDYVLLGRGGAMRVALPPGFSVKHLQEGMNVTILTTSRSGHVVAERIWKSPREEYGI